MMKFYVLHSPRQNGTWRGIKKCYTYTDGSVATLFDNEELAISAQADDYWDVWPILVDVPRIGTKKPDGDVDVIEVGDRWAVVQNGKFIGTVLKADGQWTYQSTNGEYWFPKTGHHDSKQAAIKRLVEEWGDH